MSMEPWFQTATSLPRNHICSYFKACNRTFSFLLENIALLVDICGEILNFF